MRRIPWLVGVVFSAWLCLAGESAAQQIPWPRGDQLTVDVQIDTASLEPGAMQLFLCYLLSNDPGSVQGARRFFVQATAQVVSLGAPDPEELWVRLGPTSDEKVVFWGTISREQGDVAPGTSRSGFEIRALGLPGIVRFWAQGRYDPPVAPRGQEDQVAEAPPVEQNSFTGLTVGPVPLETSDPPGLLNRLQGLRGEVCELVWIDNRGVCNSLEKKLENSARSLDRGQESAARGEFGAFVNELEAQRGKHINANAYWLLKLNAQFLLFTIG